MKEFLKNAAKSKCLGLIGDVLMVANIAINGYLLYSYIKTKQENKKQDVEEVADAEKHENS